MHPYTAMSATARPDPSALPPSGAARPAVSPLQRAWLRELGVERLWLPREPAAVRAQPPEAGAAAPAQAASAAPAAGPGMQAGSPAEAPRPDGAAEAGRTPAVPARHASSTHVQAALQSLQGTRAGAKGQPLRSVRPSAEPAPQGRTAAFGALREDRRAAVAEMDFDSLREAVLACEQCGLCQGRRQAVFGTGAQPASWLVVGEAPGEQEDRQGLPFVGRSGQLLDAMLASLGRSRQQDVYIANVIKCRPPGNRNPRPEEIAACSPYLMRQIELLGPERILVMGRFAAQTLLQTEASIGSLRGRVHHLRTPGGREIPMVVTYHPAYLLRSPHEKARAWQDLRLAASL